MCVKIQDIETSLKMQRNSMNIVLTENVHILLYLFLTKNFKLPLSNF